jgi:hypothetical protein
VTSPQHAPAAHACIAHARRAAGRAREPTEEDIVTVTARVSPDLADTPCSVADCLEPAALMGRATVHIDPETAAPPDFGAVTFGLPMCTDHAHLLRLGCTLDHFSSGL